MAVSFGFLQRGDQIQQMMDELDRRMGKNSDERNNNTPDEQ